MSSTTTHGRCIVRPLPHACDQCPYLSYAWCRCSFFPRHAIKALGTIVDLSSFRFSVTKSRATKIRLAIQKLRRAVAADSSAVPAKLVASFIGLIWSIASCCHRAASVMVRAITATLSDGLREGLSALQLPIALIVNRFWSGTVRWTAAAERQLRFWEAVRFFGLSAPISADVLGLHIERSFWYPSDLNLGQVSFLFQDASAFAAGGGLLSAENGVLRPARGMFLAEFSARQCLFSSTLRELYGIFWCLKATKDGTRYRVVFICDNWQSCRAILRGSRIPAIQEVAEMIFLWCLENNRVCWPVWVPRTHALIREADRRSRLRIPHDERSPRRVVAAANNLALQLWGSNLTFDQAASHRSAVWVNGHQLPFNAMCFQPGASGVDMFRCPESWLCNVNYVFPPAPMTGRLLTFLPTTRARSVVALRAPVVNEWWSFAVQPHSPGLVASRNVSGFKIFAFDFCGSRKRGGRCRPPPSGLAVACVPALACAGIA